MTIETHNQASTNKLWTEKEVRNLRDKVYNQKASDFEWSICGPNWMKPDSIKWLLEQDMNTDKI